MIYVMQFHSDLVCHTPIAMAISYARLRSPLLRKIVFSVRYAE